MNQGQPPYGDPSAWGTPDPQGQAPQPGYAGQPSYTGQPGYPGAPYGMNQQPSQPQGYGQQRQNVYGQPSQPYGQPVQQPYGQYGQSPYGQSMQQPYEQPQTYQSQARQPQTYQQQSWQPYGQVPQQNYQPYGQQPVQPGQQAHVQGQYPQYNQQGQPVYPQQGFSGYVSKPAEAEKRQGLPKDILVKAALFGVLPVLFVLGLVLGSTVLKWVFLGAAVAGIVAMWMMDVVTPNGRLTMSLVYGAMAVVALVSALNGPVLDAKNPDSVGQQSQSGGIVVDPAPSTQNEVPTATPTVAPDPNAVEGAAVEQLKSFFYAWSANNDENMIALTAPSWRRSVESPQKALFNILVNRTPDDDCEIKSITGTDNDTTRTATVHVTIDKHNNRAKERYAFKIIMLKEDGIWYVDPRSLESHDKETATPATQNTTPTQPPLYEGTPDTILYYNPDGGSLYHLDANCQKVGRQYVPLKGSFYFRDIDQAPYNELTACNVCGAPIPE